jgi:ferritin-like metal-binding protein YciE
MEHSVLEMLDDNAQAAQSSELERLLRHHQDETREQIANLEQAFAALGWEVDDSPCPAIEGIETEGKATVKMADDAVIDDVLLSGAAETEHHEIAVYEGLITHPQAMGKRRRRRTTRAESRAGAAHARAGRAGPREGRGGVERPARLKAAWGTR